MIVLKPDYHCRERKCKGWDCFFVSAAGPGECQYCGSPLKIGWAAADGTSSALLNERENKRDAAISRTRKAAIKVCFLLLGAEKEKVIREKSQELREHPEIQFRRLSAAEIADFQQSIRYATRGNATSATQAFM